MAKMTFRTRKKSNELDSKKGFYLSVKEAKYLKNNKIYKKILILSILLNIALIAKHFI